MILSRRLRPRMTISGRKCDPPHRQVVLDLLQRRAVRQAQRAPAVAEGRPPVKNLHQLRNHPITNPKEPSHIGLLPDELASGARAADHIEIIGVREQLQDVPAQERAVGFRHDDDIARCFSQAAPQRMPVALLRLAYQLAPEVRLASSEVRSLELLSTTMTSSTISADQEVFDGRTDIALFVERRQDDRNGLRPVHGYGPCVSSSAPQSAFARRRA